MCWKPGKTASFADIPYARRSMAQKLDIYLPGGGKGPFPVVVFIHGGAFAAGDKADEQVRPWLGAPERGYALASVNYRLSGEATFPAGLRDVKAAIRFLKAHAGEYRLDPCRMAACGDSAGGYYAAMVCLTADRPEFEDHSLENGGYSSGVNAAVDWYGPTDFLMMDSQLAAAGLGPGRHSAADSPESRLLGACVAEEPALVQKVNPVNYVHTGMPPMLIQHGSADAVVPCGQSELLAAEIERVAGPGVCEFDVLQGASHGGSAFETQENMAKVYAFLERHMGGA